MTPQTPSSHRRYRGVLTPGRRRRLAGDEHRTRSVPYDVVRYRPEQRALDPASATGSQDDRIRGHLLCQRAQSRARTTFEHPSLDIVDAEAVGGRVHAFLAVRAGPLLE